MRATLAKPSSEPQIGTSMLVVSLLLVVLYSCNKFVLVTTSSVVPSLAPALYVFGDSLFDSGNNNLLPTVAKADFLPYGVNFVGGVTGRFTNGRTVADFIGIHMCIKHISTSLLYMYRFYFSTCVHITRINVLGGPINLYV